MLYVSAPLTIEGQTWPVKGTLFDYHSHFRVENESVLLFCMRLEKITILLQYKTVPSLLQIQSNNTILTVSTEKKRSTSLDGANNSNTNSGNNNGTTSNNAPYVSITALQASGLPIASLSISQAEDQIMKPKSPTAASSHLTIIKETFLQMEFGQKLTLKPAKEIKEMVESFIKNFVKYPPRHEDQPETVNSFLGLKL